jgi:putative transposase
VTFKEAAAYIDFLSRPLAGGSRSAAITAQLVAGALVMAIARPGRPDALRPRSDRDGQYTSEPLQRCFKDPRVVCTMSRSSNIWDDAAIKTSSSP